MAKLAFVVALISLVVAILAYQKAAGSGGLDELRTLKSALEVMRQETADTLARIERSIRPADAPEGAPGKAKP
jgi:hypothetical protein